MSKSLPIEYADPGEQRVERLVLRVYRAKLRPMEEVAPRKVGLDSSVEPAAAKPSIAVLPFDNMRGDPEQEYFADGIAKDILTALTRHRWLLVAARNSSFAYKGQSVDVRRIAEDLGATFVLEGSVRRAGTQRIRAHPCARSPSAKP